MYKFSFVIASLHDFIQQAVFGTILKLLDLFVPITFFDQKQFLLHFRDAMATATVLRIKSLVCQHVVRRILSRYFLDFWSSPPPLG